jgi:uncharacterized protein YeaO (DUF488 family)
MTLRTKRVYEPPEQEDGLRVLVDRIWPRGLSKERAAVDLWLKEIAPSRDLRRWFGHDPSRWQEFKRRYFRELSHEEEPLNELRSQARKNTVTLLFGTREERYNNAEALKEYLRQASARTGTDSG